MMRKHDPYWTGTATLGPAAADEVTVEQPARPSFMQHHAVAQALLRTFQEALGPQIAAKGVIAREDFDRACTLMTRNWPRALPLFARTCRACRDSGPDATALQAPEDDGDDRRQDFVTRLMFATVVRQVPETQDPLTGIVFPRVIVPGLQAHLAALFYEKEWEAMNADARAIVRQARTDRDEELWARITGHATLPVLTHALFVRVMLRFKQFQFQRQNFIRRMVDLTGPKSFPFADEHFEQIFEALFGHLREELRTELGRARLDVRYGDETSGHLLRIFDAFDTVRAKRQIPVRGLGGALRPPATAQPMPMAAMRRR